RTKVERTDYFYDNLGQLSSTKRCTSINSDGSAGGDIETTAYVYGRNGQLLQKTTTHPNSGSNVTTFYEYDGLGRLTKAIDASGRISLT
ncbi:hypothetical protein, partial [Mycobacterium tuberculosis]